ncbi:MAG: hypothetical protein ACLFU6_12030, partial [Candidatus Hydrogenedentota bacterium]
SIVTPDGEEHEDVYIRATEHLYYIQVPDSGEIITVRRDEVDGDDVEVHPDPDHREQLLREWHEARGLERADPEAQAEERIEELTPEEPVVADPPKPADEAEEPRVAPSLEDVSAPEFEPESEEEEPGSQPEIETEEPIIDEPLNDFSVPDEESLSEGENGAMDAELNGEPRDPIDISVPDEEPQDSAEGEDVAVDEELGTDSREPIEISVPEDERRDSSEDRRRLMEIREMFRQMQMQQQVGGQQPGMGGPQQQQPGAQPGGPQQQQPGAPQEPGGPQQQQPGAQPGGPGGEEGAPAPPPPEGDEQGDEPE